MRSAVGPRVFALLTKTPWYRHKTCWKRLLLASETDKAVTDLCEEARLEEIIQPYSIVFCSYTCPVS